MTVSREAAPPLPHPEVLAGLRERVAAGGARALLVTQPANVRYLSGFTTPADGRVLVTETDAVLLTDARYRAQAAEESRLEVVIDRSWKDRVPQLAGGGRLAVEAEHLTVAEFDDLAQRLDERPVPMRALLEPYRRVKTAGEVEAIRRAARLTDEAFAHVLDILEPGLTEIDVALEIERFLRRRGAGVGFEIIVASGPRSAMPHGVATPKTLVHGELVTLDFGASVDGYTADMTRTVALGDPGDRAREIHAAVLAALELALEQVRPGASGRELDRLARERLGREGLAEAFGHSLGHGVGLEIHEGPSLSQRADDTLEPGNVVTVEPGAYFPGELGVRIEDLVVVTSAGGERLSHSPRGLLSVP